MGDQLPARPGHLDVEPGPATRGHLDVEPTGPRKSGYVADTRRWVVLALFGANTFLWAGSWCVCTAPDTTGADAPACVGATGTGRELRAGLTCPHGALDTVPQQDRVRPGR
jgi:hypothetical protein